MLCLISIFVFVFAAQTPCHAQMTDDAVVEYVKKGMSEGKSQDAMVKELMAKGVTKDQVMRIKNAMQSSSANGAVREAGAQERSRRSLDSFSTEKKDVLGSMSERMEEMSDTLFVTPDMKIKEQNEDKTDKEEEEVKIFGHDIFTNPELTFAPNENIATPENYRLGTGDEVIIDIWGTNQNTIRQTISPDGFINIEGIGLLYLSGMTIKEADRYVRRQLNQIYSVDGEEAQSDIKLTLGALRTVKVNVMGEVKVPGTYFLSSLSSVYHALYRAGGVTPLGSLRNIELVRDGKTMADVDVYDLLVKGQADGDVILQDGDIILVPTYEMLVEIAGKVKRPMLYELKAGETLAAAIQYAGGFMGDAYSENLNITRRNGREYQVYTVEKPEFASFAMMDADMINVGAIINRYENKLEVRGAVYRPGIYQLSDRVNTVSELIAIADGLKGDAFTARAILQRELDDYTLETIAVDLGAVLKGETPDVPLKKNDILYVSSIHDLNDLGVVTVNGEVANPREIVFSKNMTVEDAIIQAGGLLESASLARVDVSRRLKDPFSQEISDTLSKVYSFPIKEGYVIDGSDDFILQPYDQIFVRRSPKYAYQTVVEIDGEVIFPGSYTLERRSERISGLVKQAGGVSQWAYVKGARLSRKMNDDEKARLASTIAVAQSGRDSIDVSMIAANERYYVGIDLEQAIANPGSDADLVLREGDILEIPQFVNSVKISGNVMYPNTVTYLEGMTVRDYVQQAGGFGYMAKKKRAYVVYMNGKVTRARQFSRSVVEPGCEIVVPNKKVREGQLEKFLSIATTSSSVATMLATVANLIK